MKGEPRGGRRTGENTSCGIFLGWEDVAAPDTPCCGCCDYSCEAFVVEVWVSHEDKCGLGLPYRGRRSGHYISGLSLQLISNLCLHVTASLDLVELAY